MANKYVQITATGNYSQYNDYVFEYTNSSTQGYFKYINDYPDNWETYYIYLSSSNKIATTGTSLAETGTLAETTAITIKAYPKPPMDWDYCHFGSTVHTNTAAITAAKTQAFTITTAGNYEVIIEETGQQGGQIQFYYLNGSQKQYVSQLYTINGYIGIPIYFYSGTYYYEISGSSINIDNGNLKIRQLPSNLVMSNGVAFWMSPYLASNANIYTKGLSFGSAATEDIHYYTYGTFEKCKTTKYTTIDLNDVIIKPTTTLSNKLQTINDYYCTTSQVYVYIPAIAGPGLHYTLTESKSGLSAQADLNSGTTRPSIYYYDIGLLPCYLMLPAPNSANPITLTLSNISGTAHPGVSSPTTLSEKSSLVLHNSSSVNYTLSAGAGKFLYMGGTMTLHSKTTYFAIEMALKNASGRILQIQPVGGTLQININGVIVSYNFSTSSWTSYTSPSSSQRKVWYNNSVGKSVTYVNDYTVSSGYITITNAKYTVYGSSGTYTTTSYNGTYWIYSSTTAGGVTFTVEEYSNISKGHAGFQILSGF